MRFPHTLCLHRGDTIALRIRDLREDNDHETREETLSRLLSAMTVEEKVGQLFFARCPETDGAALVQQYHLGGYLLFGRDFKNKSADEVRDAIHGYQNTVQIPLLIGADEEGGTVVRISSNPQLRETPFLSPQQLYAQGTWRPSLPTRRKRTLCSAPWASM